MHSDLKSGPQATGHSGYPHKGSQATGHSGYPHKTIQPRPDNQATGHSSYPHKFPTHLDTPAIRTRDPFLKIQGHRDSPQIYK